MIFLTDRYVYVSNAGVASISWCLCMFICVMHARSTQAEVVS